jgi:hypothetical protein
MNKSLKKTQFAIIIFAAIAAILIGGFIVYNEINPASQASDTEVSLKDYKPEEIIQGETETILVNGSGFNEGCVFFLGTTRLESSFMNSVSIELEIPDQIESDELRTICVGSEDTMKLQVIPSLDELPE